MKIEEYIPLKKLTTLKVGGTARFVVSVVSKEEVREAVLFAKTHTLPFYVLGEGSNVLPQDEGYDGVIIRIGIPGTTYEVRENNTLITAGAGVIWDDLVRDVAHRNLWGFENLAGIPGTVGAAPVQNIGAYGADISQTLQYVEVYDAEHDAYRHISKEDCALGYRDSRFKHESNLIIVAVAFLLSSIPAPRIEYGDLLAAKEQGIDLSTPTAIGTAVRAIRSKKFPDLQVYGTAGSFFKNPVLSLEVYEKLTQEHGAIPRFPHPTGIKIPLAFILDKILNLRGFRLGNAWLFGAQPLVLVLDADGTSNDIETLAREVEEKVRAATHIRIEREVRTMPTK